METAERNSEQVIGLVPPALAERLRERAAAEERSASFIIRKALEQYLDEGSTQGA